MSARSSRRDLLRASLFGALSLGSLHLAATACSSSDSNPTPPQNSFTTSSSSSSSGSTSSSSGAGGATSSSSSSSSSSSGSSSSGGGAGGAGGQPNCTGPNDCYQCAPKTEPQFLNQCTTSQCSHFDDVARLPLYNGGNLPALP